MGDLTLDVFLTWINSKRESPPRMPMAFHRRSVIYKCKILRLMGNCGDFLPKLNRSALFHSLRQNRLGEGELGLTGKILFDIFRDFFILILQIFKQLNFFEHLFFLEKYYFFLEIWMLLEEIFEVWNWKWQRKYCLTFAGFRVGNFWNQPPKLCQTFAIWKPDLINNTRYSSIKRCNLVTYQTW